MKFPILACFLVVSLSSCGFLRQDDNQIHKSDSFEDEPFGNAEQEIARISGMWTSKDNSVRMYVANKQATFYTSQVAKNPWSILDKRSVSLNQGLVFEIENSPFSISSGEGYPNSLTLIAEPTPLDFVSKELLRTGE